MVAQGYCALYGTAGHRADKDALDRPNNTRAQPVAGDAFRTLQVPPRGCDCTVQPLA